jgi:hypothetical protein
MTAIVGNACKLEISPDNSTWYDISGYATSVDPGEMVRNDGEVFVFGSDKGKVTTGKLAVREINIEVLYNESGTVPYGTIRSAIDSNSTYYIRWSPTGGGSGSYQYTSDAGKWVSVNDPGAEADSADPIVLTATFKTPYVTKGTVK